MPGAVLDSGHTKIQTLPQAAGDMKTAFRSRLVPRTPDVEVVRNRSSNWNLIYVCNVIFILDCFFKKYNSHTT